MLVATMVTLVVPAATVGADPSTTTTTAVPSQSQINATESQVATIEAQISQEQKTLDQADEQYDQAMVNLTVTRSSLTSTTAAITVNKSQLDADRIRLSHDAVNAYVNDTSTQSIANLFAPPSQLNEERQTYDNVAVGDVVHDVKVVQAGQRRLSGLQAKLISEQQNESSQAAQLSQIKEVAAAAANQSQATLNQVKGTLAQQIAAQAAAQAAAAAAAAAAAKSQAAAQAAANQANQAAQVASTVGAGSAAATNAAEAASQAAGSAGDVNIGYGGSPTAAGLAAVHGAMQYLGVPYVWGGASMAGVDCSGLTMLAWAQAGVTMDHSAADQYASFTHVSLTSLEPGDLLAYDFDGTGVDHIVMYVGPILDGHATPYGVDTIIQAAHTGTVVEFDPFFSEGLVGAARP